MQSKRYVHSLVLVGMMALAVLSGLQLQAATIYLVTVDTASLVGSPGIIDMQFNPGGVTSQAATALVTSFTGGTLGSVVPPVIGPVTGTLPTGDLLFQNNANTDYAHGILFGSSFQFRLTLDGVALTAPDNGPAGTSFGLFLYDPGFAPLITGDGLLAQIDINPDGGITTTGFGGTTFQDVSGIPEPGTVTSMLLGGCALAFLRKAIATKKIARQ